ncbi:MAG: DNA repair protein RadC [Proteobacteria bacterium]|nr:DNA repair protein RadC [Pseudomonadota bacterium]MBU1541457.1 DNA repair protein RadC [Pseudomonadota bacterium]MBU2430500.1 DNA repair protein RadC [Pseudomonadota bacterium]MBU2480293.1 DNA repair protein RadC [Pseudomonadota bacterium]
MKSRQMDLFSEGRVKPVDFKEALMSGQLAGMVKEVVKGETVSNPETLFNILTPLMAQHKDIEKFYCIFLDTKNRVIDIEAAFSGSLSSCTVYPREIIKACLKKNAASLIVAHNHPSGDITPSNEDKKLTRLIFSACHVMGIVLHEHLICGAGEFMSMQTEGTITGIKNSTRDFFR